MTARIPAIAFRLLVLVTVWLLGTSTLSLAKDDGAGDDATATEPATTGEAPAEPGILVAPDLRDLPYVFAKGVLEDRGFAWRVEGKVEGYAVNLVAEQSLKPGTLVVDNGAPTIVIRLVRADGYDELGLPTGGSPYPGTKVVLAGADATVPSTEPAPETPDDSTGAAAESPATGPGSDTEDSSAAVSEATPGETVPTTDAENAAETTGSAGDDAEEPAKQTSADAPASEQITRPPAFDVPGAPDEPRDEMPLPARARLLGAWLAKQPAMTSADWEHYTYQHAWVVTGANFGWWHGAEALRVLITVDQELQQRFDAGSGLEQTARTALTEVLRKSSG